MKDIYINFQEAEQTPSRMNSKRPCKTHLKDKDKENLESSKREAPHHIQGILKKIIEDVLAKRQWVDTFNVLKEKKKNLSIKNPVQ